MFVLKWKKKTRDIPVVKGNLKNVIYNHWSITTKSKKFIKKIYIKHPS